MGRPDTESHSTRGPIDRTKLRLFREEFVRLEPLATGELDDPMNPTELQLILDDGVGSSTDARLDVRWTTQEDYNVHYTDSGGRNLRWDVHPHEYPNPVDEAHFHPPPDASNAREDVAVSCIEVREVELVSRATYSLWRTAYDDASFENINAAENPP